MKLVFVKPKTEFPRNMEKLLFEGLYHDDIYIGSHTRELKEYSVSWNNVYGFYDISLFPIMGNPGNTTAQIDEFRDWLKKEKYRFTEDTAWNWFTVKGMREVLYGVRFFVYPKNR